MTSLNVVLTESAGSTPAALLTTLLPFVILIVVFYFLLIRPENKKKKALNVMRMPCLSAMRSQQLEASLERIVHIKDDHGHN